MSEQDEDAERPEAGRSLLDVLVTLGRHWRVVVLVPLLVGVAAVGLSFAIPKTYLSRTLFVPPQQAQSSASAMIAQLGALSGLANAAGAIKTPADQYIALLRSAAITDRLVDQFDLMKVYDVEYRFRARKELEDNTRITLGKKDGLVTIEVEDRSAERAARMANQYVEELKRLSASLALSEAQQRRVMFEAQLARTRDQLKQAQSALQQTGFSQGALKTDAKASAEGYARLRAEVTAAELRLQVLRRNLSDTTPEVQQALTALGLLRAQLSKFEDTVDLSGAPADYVSKFRDFKYQETLFELLARQYELARLDEAREGALIQVVDEAKPAEYKHRPLRALIGVGAALAALLVAAAYVLLRDSWRQAWRDRDAYRNGPDSSSAMATRTK